VLGYETRLKARGYDLIIGVDEAGRGPLAGPVLAAAVLLKSRQFKNRIDDSKKLSARERKKAYLEIRKKSLYSIVAVNHKKIDRVNILQATILAMQQAVARLAAKLKPGDLKRAYVVVDGNMRFNLNLPYQSIIGGDAKSLSIAAASILAKERRDRIMAAYHKVYPQYEFIKHKGYPTLRHRMILKEKGPSPIHRKSFLKCLQET